MKARHDLVPFQRVVRAQGARGDVSLAPFVDLVARRPDHPYERHAALQPLLHLAVHLLARLTGRGGLDDQIVHDADLYVSPLVPTILRAMTRRWICWVPS